MDEITVPNGSGRDFLVFDLVSNDAGRPKHDSRELQVK